MDRSIEDQFEGFDGRKHWRGEPEFKSKYRRLEHREDPLGCKHQFVLVDEDKRPGVKACSVCGAALYADARNDEFIYDATERVIATQQPQIPERKFKKKEHGRDRPNIRSTGQERA